MSVQLQSRFLSAILNNDAAFHAESPRAIFIYSIYRDTKPIPIPYRHSQRQKKKYYSIDMSLLQFINIYIPASRRGDKNTNKIAHIMRLIILK